LHWGSMERVGMWRIRTGWQGHDRDDTLYAALGPRPRAAAARQCKQSGDPTECSLRGDDTTERIRVLRLSPIEPEPVRLVWEFR
jgi:hypothetical protein